MSQVSHEVNLRLEEILKVLNKKNQLRMSSTNGDPDYGGAVAEFSWLPGYMIKLGAEVRIAGGKILLTCVTEKKLDLIVIPKQELYLIPQTHAHLTRLTSLCISEKIEGTQNKKLTLEQVEQLIELTKETGVADLKWQNLVHCENGKIAIIDTESFWGARYGLDSLLWRNECDPGGVALIERALKEVFPLSYKK